MGLHHFVFIGGLHRSGTSLLFHCLREHPLISGFRDTGVPEDEGQHLQSVYPAARNHGGPGQFGFDPESHLTENSSMVTEGNRAKLLYEWSRHWDLTKPVLLEKSPPNLIRTRFLQALFPSASFVVIVRHPVAVAYATQNWTGASLSSLIEHWLLCHETFKRDREHLNRACLLKYEDFIKDPNRALATIYGFLRLTSFHNRVTVRKNANEAYLARWRDTTSRVSDEDETIQERFGERVARFGYSLSRE